VINFQVLTNDSDPDADTLTLVSATDPAHGTTALTIADAVTYTPDANYCGSDTFDYTVRDPSGATAVGHVFVTVVCVNDAPVIAPVADKATPWGEAVAATLSSEDPDSPDTATYSLASGPVGASVSPGGVFTWTPTASQVGPHLITVRVTDTAGAFTQTAFTVSVSRRATAVLYTGVSSGQYSDPAALSAVVTDVLSGAPVPGRVVTFTIGALGVSATSDAAGVASASLLLVGPVGASPLTTAFPGDAAYVASSDSDAFTLAKELATVHMTGRHLTLAAPSPVQLTATVVEEADGFLGSALASAQVTFAQVGGPVLCSAQVSVSGPGFGSATCATASLGVGSRAIVATLVGPAYTSPADVAVITVATPGTGDAAGAGQVGQDDDFGFQAKASKKDGPTGDAVHVFVAGGSAYVVQSSSLTSLSRSCTGGSQKICSTTVQAANATTFIVDLSNGTVIAMPGTSSIRIDATDAAEPAGGSTPPDRYAVAITGATTHTLGSPTAQLLIGYGNVRVPS
jgi:hypothetical protein